MVLLKKNNKNDPKFKIADIVRISKYKNCTPDMSEEVFMIKKVKITVPCTYFINSFNGEEIIGTFYENKLQKTNQKEFRIEKVIKKKDDKLYVKWNGYDNSINSWIDKKDIVYMSKCYPKPLSLDANVKVELNLSNYATKADLKMPGVDTSDFAKKG